jgi:hypothetical protein
VKRRSALQLLEHPWVKPFLTTPRKQDDTSSSSQTVPDIAKNTVKLSSSSDSQRDDETEDKEDDSDKDKPIVELKRPYMSLRKLSFCIADFNDVPLTPKGAGGGRISSADRLLDRLNLISAEVDAVRSGSSTEEPKTGASKNPTVRVSLPPESSKEKETTKTPRKEKEPGEVIDDTSSKSVSQEKVRTKTTKKQGHKKSASDTTEADMVHVANSPTQSSAGGKKRLRKKSLGDLDDTLSATQMRLNKEKIASIQSMFNSTLKFNLLFDLYLIDDSKAAQPLLNPSGSGTGSSSINSNSKSQSKTSALVSSAPTSPRKGISNSNSTSSSSSPRNSAKEILSSSGTRDARPAVRLYIRDGPMTKVCRGGNKKRWFFLFSDLMLYASSGIKGKFTLHGIIPMADCRLIENIECAQPRTCRARRYIVSLEIDEFVSPCRFVSVAKLGEIFHRVCGLRGGEGRMDQRHQERTTETAE